MGISEEACNAGVGEKGWAVGRLEREAYTVTIS